MSKLSVGSAVIPPVLKVCWSLLDVDTFGIWLASVLSQKLPGAKFHIFRVLE